MSLLCLYWALMYIYLCKRINKRNPKRHFQTKKILKNSKTFLVPCLQRVGLKVSLKLNKKS